jgi:polysaccharide biosynthesis/export protein
MNSPGDGDGGSFWERCKFMAGFADYSDDADLAKSADDCAIFLDCPSFQPVMAKHFLAILAVGMLATAAGCHAIDFYTPSLQSPIPPELEPPRELSMVSLPVYRISPPDVIRIEVVKLVPRASHRIEPFDVLLIRVLGTLKSQPIDKQYPVEADGTVVLGASYGTLRVEGMTIEEVETELTRILKMTLRQPVVSVQLTRSAAAEQLSGMYPVQLDGTVNLRSCGMIYLAGTTVTEAREAVEARLNQYFDSPRVGVEVVQFNSKSYFVIDESSTGKGTMLRFPIMGNETVLDAIAQLDKVTHMTSKTIWVSRPAPGDCRRDQVLPVNWDEIAHGGKTDTNYQLLPGDRVYIVDDRAVGINAFLSKFASPIERLLGISSEGTRAALDAEAQGREYNKRGTRGGGGF